MHKALMAKSPPTTREFRVARSNQYSGVSICPELNVGERCFKVQRYAEGAFRAEFHEHVPRHRINADDALEAIRMLVATFAGFAGSQILSALLNKRGKTPANSGRFGVHVEYPEPGVLRNICGGDVLAWVDEVIGPDSFNDNRTKCARPQA